MNLYKRFVDVFHKNGVELGGGGAGGAVTFEIDDEPAFVRVGEDYSEETDYGLKFTIRLARKKIGGTVVGLYAFIEQMNAGNDYTLQPAEGKDNWFELTDAEIAKFGGNYVSLGSAPIDSFSTTDAYEGSYLEPKIMDVVIEGGELHFTVQTKTSDKLTVGDDTIVMGAPATLNYTESDLSQWIEMVTVVELMPQPEE